jgi:glycogen operon protein
MDWDRVASHRDTLSYFQRMIEFRKTHPALWQPSFYTGQINERGLRDVAWHGTELNSPGFGDPDARALACTIAGFNDRADLHVMMNMFWEPLVFEVPVVPGRSWRIAIETFAANPDDLPVPGRETSLPDSSCTVRERSIVVLVNR